MLEEFAAQMEQHCSAAFAAKAAAVDLAAAESGNALHRLFQSMAVTDEAACTAALAGYLSYRLTPRASREAQRGVMTIANAVEYDRQAQLGEAITRAWGLIKYHAPDATVYFRFAGLYELPLPPNVAAQFAESQINDHTDAATRYYSYLLMIGDPAGKAAFADALSRAEPDVDRVNGLLGTLINTGFAMRRQTSPLRDVRGLLAPYRDDTRRTTGVEGPGSGGALQGIVTPALAVLENQ